MTIKEIQDSIIDEFSLYEDWMDKYAYIIDLGKECPLIDEKYKNDKYLIEGCQSRVWLHCEMRDGRLWFSADSDAVITKGIIYLLIRVFNGQKPQDIFDCDIEFLDKIGLREHLSPTRSNGLTAMIKQLRTYALAYTIKG